MSKHLLQTPDPALPYFHHCSDLHKEALRMGTHGDGKGGEEGDKNQSNKEKDGQWNKPVTDPPKKKK